MSRTLDAPRMRVIHACTVYNEEVKRETLNHLANVRCKECGAHAIISRSRVCIPHYVHCSFIIDFMMRHPKTEKWMI